MFAGRALLHFSPYRERSLKINTDLFWAISFILWCLPCSPGWRCCLSENDVRCKLWSCQLNTCGKYGPMSYALCTHAQQPRVFVDITNKCQKAQMLLSRLSPAPCTKLLIGSYARIEQLIVQWSHMSGSHFLHKPNISISGNAAKVDCLLLCDACEKWQLWLASQPDFSCWWHHVEVYVLFIIISFPFFVL